MKEEATAVGHLVWFIFPLGFRDLRVCEFGSRHRNRPPRSNEDTYNVPTFYTVLGILERTAPNNLFCKLLILLSNSYGIGWGRT